MSWEAAVKVGLMAVWLPGIAFLASLRIRDRSWWWATSHMSQAIGGALNFTAVALNGWRMPVLEAYAWDVTKLGQAPLHKVLDPDTARVPWLCDVLLYGTSVGDWLLAVVPLTLLALYWTNRGLQSFSDWVAVDALLKRKVMR